MKLLAEKCRKIPTIQTEPTMNGIHMKKYQCENFSVKVLFSVVLVVVVTANG